MARSWQVTALVSLLALALVPGLGATHDAALHFEATTGANQNYFLRDGEVAAHLLLRSGLDPRILVAFPAGDSGVGLWFRRSPLPVQWTLESPPAAVRSRDKAGRALLGIAFDVASAGPALIPRQAVLSSVRVLRDYQANGSVPTAVAIRPAVSGRTLGWSRDRLDGAPGYRLLVEVRDGTLAPDGSISAGADRRIRLRVTALSGEQPLSAIAASDLLNGRQVHDPIAERVLAFLSYQQKFLAGSWRFDTYFGRDTLLSLQMLMPVLKPAGIEAGLRSVLERLAPDGEVAHEEAIGEFAILEHERHEGTLSDAPIYDYGMIDGNYLLAPLIALVPARHPRGRTARARFSGAPAGRRGIGA